jgi:two-component system alkaline phosphatase synthesis response regulator PhoP
VTRVLIIEDNDNLATGLRDNLELEGHEAVVASDGPVGLTRVRESAPDLVILDLTLPGFDGYRVLRSMREDGLSMPVLILTARADEADKVRGLRLGADDYVTKPFGLLELMARVEALLRRGRSPASVPRRAPLQPIGDPVRFGEIEVHAAARAVTRAGRPVPLRPKEFELLLALIRRHGQVARRLDLLREVWGYVVDVRSRTVDTHIADLRRKLEVDPSTPRHIITVRKTGYRLER